MRAYTGPIADQLIALLPRLRRFARALVSNSRDADDLVQVTVERAVTHFDEWRPGIRLESWLFGILRNAWLDQTRAQRRRDRQLAPDSQTARVADRVSNSRIQHHPLPAAMEQLADDQRLVMALVLVEGLAYKEVADLLEVPMDTVTSRLAHAREALETLLGGREAG